MTDMSRMGQQVHVSELLQEAEAALQEADDPTLQRRILVWKKRLEGWSGHETAEQLGVSYVTVYADLKWCYANLPCSYGGADEVLRVSLERLEQMIRVMAPRRSEGDADAVRLTDQLIDRQAKLMGLYTARLELRQVNYTIESVDLDQLT